MAIRFNVDEQEMITGNAFLFEERLKSPTVRMQDKTPTFVTYYHINNAATTTDAGFVDVASILGHRSPIRFHKIKQFPIYGIDQVLLQLGDDDQGLDSSYEGEATILPSTIKPLQNDMFIIPYIGTQYVFKITGIEYDNIMPDNFYKINYKLDYIGEDYVDKLENQVEDGDTSVCILNNIGSDSECIIKEEELFIINKIKEMYDQMVTFYMDLFYNERHNAFLCKLDDVRYLYDPFQTIFINNHRLFNEKSDFRTLMLTEQCTDKNRNLKYAKSVYRYIELRRNELLTNFPYTIKPGTAIRESSFYTWYEKNIYVLDIPEYMVGDIDNVFSDDFKTSIYLNAPLKTEYGELIRKYVRKKELEIKNIPLNLQEELLYLNNSEEVFFFTPIIMYIVRDIVEKELKKEK